MQRNPATGAKIRILIALLVCMFISSCGDSRFKKTYPVKGQVFFENKPASGATVFFHAVTYPNDPWLKPSGTVDEAGFFTLSSYESNDGAPAGPYVVTIIWLPKGYRGPIENANKLPERYSKKDTSDIKAEITDKAENNLEPFHLKR